MPNKTRKKNDNIFKKNKFYLSASFLLFHYNMNAIDFITILAQ